MYKSETDFEKNHVAYTHISSTQEKNECCCMCVRVWAGSSPYTSSLYIVYSPSDVSGSVVM